VAGITDLPATQAAYAAGVGATIHTKIGAALDPKSGSVIVDAKIVFLLDTDNAMERQAVVRVGGIDIVLASRRRPYHNIADFTRLGLDPHKASTVVVKSGYLSPELAPIANPNFMMLSDGAVNQSHARLPRTRKLVPTFPFDPDISWSPRPVFSSRSAVRMQA
jgi:microcystin degradation protein MlrC